MSTLINRKVMFSRVIKFGSSTQTPVNLSRICDSTCNLGDDVKITLKTDFTLMSLGCRLQKLVKKRWFPGREISIGI